MLTARQFKGRTTSRDNDTTGSEDTSATGSRNREMRGKVERRVRRIMPDKIGECPAREFGAESVPLGAAPDPVCVCISSRKRQ